MDSCIIDTPAWVTWHECPNEIATLRNITAHQSLNKMKWLHKFFLVSRDPSQMFSTCEIQKVTTTKQCVPFLDGISGFCSRPISTSLMSDAFVRTPSFCLYFLLQGQRHQVK